MGALDGLLVIAIEQAVAAPLCTMRLADAGARVIKVERAGGETARHYDSTVRGTSAYFAWLGRGKESVVLDLKAQDDLALLHRMLAKADVLVQNLAPGAMDRMGLGVDVIAAQFPHLISVSICGYGQDTDFADMKAYDLLVQAESGVCALTGSAEAPAKVGVPVADIATGSNAHAAILEALIARGLSGQGQHIEIAMFDSLAEWASVPFLHSEYGGLATGRFGLSHATIYPYGPFECADGTVIIAVQTTEEWRRLCHEVLNRPDLLQVPEFATNTLRSDNRAMLDETLCPAFQAMTRSEAMARCQQARVAFAGLTDATDLAGHPALRTIPVPMQDGTIQVPRPAGRSGDFTANTWPELGAQTDAVRREFDAPS